MRDTATSCLLSAILLIELVVGKALGPFDTADSADTVDLIAHLEAIAALIHPSPVISVPAGWFLMGTNRKDDDPYGLETQFDNTEYPQRRIWLDDYWIDRDEVSLAEYLTFLRSHERQPSDELKRLLRHLITVHFLPDYVMAPWPALYVTWHEAADFCHAQDKRLPTEAEWEKAARGTNASTAAPVPGLAVFGQYHVHEIPLVAAVNSGEDGQSPYGVRHMAGNVGEWTAAWFGLDYYPVMPERNPPGPSTGRYKVVRGGSWRSGPTFLRTATRNGALPDQRSPTIGFRCAANRP